MWVSEKFLFLLARLLYKTQIVHTKEMKDAASTVDKYNLYRSTQIPFITDALNKYRIEIRGKTVVDFGCDDGAISHMYINEGARQVVGIDIERKAIERANDLYASANVSFCLRANSPASP